MDRMADAVRQMFGFGLMQKIIDCYVAIVSIWQPGDRIYLFGFSRGAYTARCVAHVLEVCGIPTREPGRDNLNFDPPAWSSNWRKRPYAASGSRHAEFRRHKRRTYRSVQGSLCASNRR